MLLVDSVLIVLCCAVLYFLIRMRGAIFQLSVHRQEFSGLIKEFSSDIMRAEKALDALKTSGSQNLTEIEQASKKALNLHDDLEFLVHRAEEIADRLEMLSHENIKKIHAKKPQDSQKKNHKNHDANLAQSLEGLR